MPTRLIRDGLLTSWRYERLSTDARLFYFHLLLSADDVGCLELGCTFLRRRVLFSQDSDERLAKLINELVDVDLLRPYQHEGRCFGFIPRYRQRLQIKRMKCPFPPDALIADDQHASENILKIKQLMAKNTVVQPLPNRCPTSVQPSEPEPEPEPEPEEVLKPYAPSGAMDGATLARVRVSQPKPKPPPIALPDWVPQESWDGWMAVRKNKKAPNTEYALKLALKNLEKLKQAGHNPEDVLDQSTACGWTGLFPVNSKTKTPSGARFTPEQDFKTIDYSKGW